MGRRRNSSAPRVERPKLSDHLFLFSYMNHLFGIDNFEDKTINRTRVIGLKSIVEKVKDGFDDDGHSYMFHTLSSLKGIDSRVLQKLEEYDHNIKSYVERINANRPDKVTLKYFQYLAILYTEIFLDRYFLDPDQLASELSEYALKVFDDPDAVYSMDDIRKLAYMMATGSGKTLLMHINLLQFKKYNVGPHRIKFDNILLITPNEKMSAQHLMEMQLSGIDCNIYSGNGGYFSEFVESDAVKIIDINKFTKEKSSSEGVSVDVESFGNKNLILVDEGHKGVTSGEAWVKYRNQLSEKGFTFEYSATFSQAVAAAKNTEKDELLHVYGKSIIFDYSYKYFYGDGYGKDYLIMNLSEASYANEMKHVLMMGNLLTYYEQKLLYETMSNQLKPYNIDDPLWIFVGSKVSGKKQESDILEIIKFLDRVLRNEGGWAEKTIEDIMAGRSGLLDSDKRDIFAVSYPEHRLAYLREQNLNPSDIYKDILSKVFHSSSPAPLHLFNLKSAESQIGMKCGNGNYFGLIMVSDDSGLIKLISEGLNEVKTGEDSITPSLFDMIDNKNSGLNMLIGAKMFMEGWNSWRVSCMGLINIGKNEGVQIIQMFGRGVRLKGKDHTLKRSSAIEGVHPRHLPALETLNVFGIEANYMMEFKEMLGVEGLPAGKISYDIPIKVNKELLNQKLLIPDVDESRFYHEDLVHIELGKVSVNVDLTPVIEVISAKKNDEGITSESGSHVTTIRPELIEIIDWHNIYLKMLEYRAERGWNNIIFTEGILKSIIKDNHCYTLKCPPQYVNPSSFEDIKQLETVTLIILKKYLDKYYNFAKNEWVKKNLEITELKQDNGNLSFSYEIKVNDNEVEIRNKIESLIHEQLDKLCKGIHSDVLKNIFFDRHLYQPLIALNALETDIIEVHPQGLNPGEQHFIYNIKKYWESHKEILKDSKLFVLRNLPKRGVGFFELTNYYPDFIVWFHKDDMQNLLFIDPKGLGHMNEGFEAEEIILYKEIKTIESRLLALNNKPRITLDSFIISVTPKEEADKIFSKGRPLSYDDYLAHNVLFEEDSNYIEKIFNKIFKYYDVEQS